MKMPNWCENVLRFEHNGTPEGALALQDFYNKIQAAYAYAEAKNNPWGTWECYIEDAMYNQSNGLFQYMGGVQMPKRGYIEMISDINFDCFHMVTQDAWSANNAFWYVLLTNLYGNLITFTYQASEPGMGCYYTNDAGMLPRFNVNMCVEDLNGLMQIPDVWDKENSYGPFMCLDNSHGYVQRPTGKPFGYTNNWDRPNPYHFGIDMNVEGDEDDVLSQFEEHFGELIKSNNINSIDNLANITNGDKGIYVNVGEFEYVPLEDDIANTVAQEIICGKIEGDLSTEHIVSIIKEG